MRRRKSNYYTQGLVNLACAGAGQIFKPTRWSIFFCYAQSCCLVLYYSSIILNVHFKLFFLEVIFIFETQLYIFLFKTCFVTNAHDNFRMYFMSVTFGEQITSRHRKAMRTIFKFCRNFFPSSVCWFKKQTLNMNP